MNHLGVRPSVYNNVLTDLFDIVGPRNYSYNRNTGQLKLCGSDWLVIGAKDEELTAFEGGLQAGDELATKHAPQYGDGKEEALVGSNPAGVIAGESAGGNDTVDMGMKLEFLVPGMQHAEEADLGSEMGGIARDLQQGGPELVDRPIELAQTRCRAYKVLRLSA